MRWPTPIPAPISKRPSISADAPGLALSRRVARVAGLCILVLILLLPALRAALAQEGLLRGRVLRVVDGDTLDVRLASGRVRVRLQGIDAPERDQPGGLAATRFLASQLQDRDVWLEPVSQDQYDRLLAVVHYQGVDLNRELVREGHAWAYRRYMRRAEQELCRLEEEARRSGRGLWQPRSAPARAPWEYRATHGRGPFTDFARSDARDCLRAMGRRPGTTR
ncbi:MAG: thermonuclease family protein [Steroidobacteraceae bacterium]